MAEYVTAFDDGGTVVRHLDGVPWHEAPRPCRWHRCRPQTKGMLNFTEAVERCPCGAIRVGQVGHPWLDRNSRRAVRTSLIR